MRFLLAALPLLIAAPVLAADPPAKDAGDPNKTICKRYTPVGQLVPKKDCRTRAQWDELRQSSQDETQRMQQGPGSNTPT